MPYQLGVTIRAEVAAEQVAGLREWLAASAKDGVADGPFDFARMRGLHFAKLYLLEETADLAGRPIPASLILMTEVDAPLRRHLAELIDVPGTASIRRSGTARAIRAPVPAAAPGSPGSADISSQRPPSTSTRSAAGCSRSARRQGCGMRWRTISTSVTGPAVLPPECGANCSSTSPGAPIWRGRRSRLRRRPCCSGCAKQSTWWPCRWLC